MKPIGWRIERNTLICLEHVLQILCISACVGNMFVPSSDAGIKTSKAWFTCLFWMVKVAGRLPLQVLTGMTGDDQARS